MILTKVLIHCFGREFYRANAGFLLAAVILVIGYGLFIKTAGHIPEGQSLTINLILLVHFLQTPAITLVVCALWLIYTIKCWRYTWMASKREDQLFWRYGATSLSYTQQFIAWFLFQVYLFIPLLFYWIIVVLYGLYTHRYEVLCYSGIYLLILTVISTLLYTYHFNSLSFDKPYRLFSLSSAFKRWPKPLWSLFLWELLYHNRGALLITKGISCLFIIAFYRLFADVDQVTRTATLMALGIGLAHSVLIYRDQLFTERHLYFVRQLPYQPTYLYAQQCLTYSLMLLPELLWCAFSFRPSIALLLICLIISKLLLIRSLADRIGQHMRRYLQWVFIDFFVTVLVILYDLPWLIIGINTAIAMFIYFSSYYKREALSIK